MLAYFETLCTDTGSANVLINSSLTILIVRMLRNARAPTLRVRLASALGLLVRHATYIADELATTGHCLCQALSCLVCLVLPRHRFSATPPSFFLVCNNFLSSFFSLLFVGLPVIGRSVCLSVTCLSVCTSVSLTFEQEITNCSHL